MTEIEIAVGHATAVARDAFLLHAEALGDGAAPDVLDRRLQLHPMQPELVEREVEEARRTRA